MQACFQTDSNFDGVGDACTDDCDGDGEPDDVDTCPDNARILHTDFRGIQAVDMGKNSFKQKQPIWQFRNRGKEIFQEVPQHVFCSNATNL